MKVYTKTGDSGQTSMFGGNRVDKDDLVMVALGSIDELGAALGLALSSYRGKDNIIEQGKGILSDLFDLGAEIATPEETKQKLDMRLDNAVDADRIKTLEDMIDFYTRYLEPMKTFVLPLGSECATRLHFARAVCRRAERDLVSLNKFVPLRAEVLQYINRLSDLLFTWARFANKWQDGDIPWKAKKER